MALFRMAFFSSSRACFRDLRQFVRRNSLFRLFAKRYFVFSFFFRVAFFFFISSVLPIHHAITTGRKTKNKLNNEMAQSSHHIKDTMQ